MIVKSRVLVADGLEVSLVRQLFAFVYFRNKIEKTYVAIRDLQPHVSFNP